MKRAGLETGQQPTTTSWCREAEVSLSQVNSPLPTPSSLAPQLLATLHLLIFITALVKDLLNFPIKNMITLGSLPLQVSVSKVDFLFFECPSQVKRKLMTFFQTEKHKWKGHF